MLGMPNMKTQLHAIWLLLAISLLGLSASAAPRIQLDPMVLDLGKMQQNQVVEHDILVHNTGDEALEIYELSTTCPCTFPEIIDEVIEPGETGLIHLTFQSKTYQGDVHKVVEIYSNVPGESYHEIGIRVYVEAPVFVHPDDRKLDFGDVSNGSTPTSYASFLSDEDELEVEVLEINEALFDHEVLAAEDGNDSAKRLAVTLRADALSGPFREIIRVGSSAAGASEIDLEIIGRVESELMADPARVNFRMVAPGSELSQDLEIRSAGQAFTVTEASIDLAGLSVEILDAGPGNVAKLRIAGNALSKDSEAVTKSRGRLKGKVRISTDHPAQGELEVIVLYMLRI